MILTTLMAHQRKLIRQWLATQLAAAGTNAGARVTSTRIEPNKGTQLPAISVYTLGDETDLGNSEQTAPRELKRSINLEIAMFVGGRDSLPADDQVDDLCEQVEAFMDANRWLGGHASNSILTGTVVEIAAVDGRSDPIVGIAVLSYSITYRTSPAAASNLDNLNTVDAKQTPVGGVADTVPVEDKFTT